MKKVSKKAKRRLCFLSMALIGIVAFLIHSVFNDWMQIFNNKKEQVILKEEYQTLLDNEISLRSEVTKLSDPEYVARYAREKYLFSKDGEIIIRVPKETK